MLSEAQSQARDLRARERVYKKEIYGLNDKLNALKEERNKLKTSNVVIESELASKCDSIYNE